MDQSNIIQTEKSNNGHNKFEVKLQDCRLQSVVHL